MLQVVFLLFEGHKYDVPVFCINEPVSYPDKASTEIGLN